MLGSGLVGFSPGLRFLGSGRHHYPPPPPPTIREQMEKKEVLQYTAQKKGKESQNEDCNLYARSLTILSDNMERDDFHSCPF